MRMLPWPYKIPGAEMMRRDLAIDDDGSRSSASSARRRRSAKDAVKVCLLKR